MEAVGGISFLCLCSWHPRFGSFSAEWSPSLPRPLPRLCRWPTAPNRHFKPFFALGFLWFPPLPPILLHLPASNQREDLCFEGCVCLDWPCLDNTIYHPMLHFQYAKGQVPRFSVYLDSCAKDLNSLGMPACLQQTASKSCFFLISISAPTQFMLSLVKGTEFGDSGILFIKATCSVVGYFMRLFYSLHSTSFQIYSFTLCLFTKQSLGQKFTTCVSWYQKKVS